MNLRRNAEILGVQGEDWGSRKSGTMEWSFEYYFSVEFASCKYLDGM